MKLINDEIFILKYEIKLATKKNYLTMIRGRVGGKKFE